MSCWLTTKALFCFKLVIQGSAWRGLAVFQQPDVLSEWLSPWRWNRFVQLGQNSMEFHLNSATHSTEFLQGSRWGVLHQTPPKNWGKWSYCAWEIHLFKYLDVSILVSIIVAPVTFLATLVLHLQLILNVFLLGIKKSFNDFQISRLNLFCFLRVFKQILVL